jgi:hypothetical protein
VALLALKLTITPVAIAAATLAARRFGPSIGGWLIGLPLTAGPVVLFLAFAHGSAFAADVALGLIAGVAAQAAFVLGYVGVARRGWQAALVAGTAAFAVTGAALDLAHLPLAMLAACALAALAIGLAVVPSEPVALVAPPPRHDLPLRIALATALVVTITTFATTLGPGLSGVATVYPLLSTLVAVFAHRSDGHRAATAVYRGLLVGLFALMGFAGTLALVLSRLPLAAAFALAVVLTLSIQLGSLRAVRV